MATSTTDDLGMVDFQEVAQARSPAGGTRDEPVRRNHQTLDLPVDNDPDATLMKRSVFAGAKVAKRLSSSRPRRQDGSTSGPQWFDMTSTTLTPEIERDLQLLDNRHSLDPKRFYKSTGADSLKNRKKRGEFFQAGDVVAGAHEFFSAQLTKKEKRSRITHEFMSDADFRQRTKRKFEEIRASRSPRPRLKNTKRSNRR